jgi:hypothetical protein
VRNSGMRAALQAAQVCGISAEGHLGDCPRSSDLSRATRCDRVDLAGGDHTPQKSARAGRPRVADDAARAAFGIDEQMGAWREAFPLGRRSHGAAPKSQTRSPANSGRTIALVRIWRGAIRHDQKPSTAARLDGDVKLFYKRDS